MANQSYRERMKAQRAAAGAKREAEQAEWHRRAELRYEVAEAGDGRGQGRDHGREGTSCRSIPSNQLLEQANAIIGPWLVAQAKAQIAEMAARSAAPKCCPKKGRRHRFAPLRPCAI